MRPRQWPKNLLVFAAPLAGHTLGPAGGIWYALTAVVAFVLASSAVYLVNDVVDVERDRNHPYKKRRPIASGRLPARHAIVVAVMLRARGASAGLAIGEPLLTATIAAYLAHLVLVLGRAEAHPLHRTGAAWPPGSCCA